MKNLVVVLSLFVLSACSSRSIKPDPNGVKVSREQPSEKCHEIGTISGTTIFAQGTQDQALDDLKREAANKGANYVVVKQFSGSGTTVTGVAFECP